MKLFFSSTIREYEYISAMHITYIFYELVKEMSLPNMTKLLSVKCKFLSATNSCYIIWRLAKLSFIWYSNGSYIKILLLFWAIIWFYWNMDETWSIKNTSNFHVESMFPKILWIVLYKKSALCSQLKRNTFMLQLVFLVIKEKLWINFVKRSLTKKKSLIVKHKGPCLITTTNFCNCWKSTCNLSTGFNWLKLIVRWQLCYEIHFIFMDVTERRLFDCS